MAIRRTQSAYAVVTVAAIGASAHADFTTAQISSSTNYTFSISHMPDLDQERGGSVSQGALPNEGKYYCVPTSIMNLATYAANHGFSEVNPGPGSWSAHERYLLMSEYLGVLGNLMSTNPFTGTKHGPAAFGMNVWVTSSSDRLVIDHRARVGGWVPTIDEIAAQMYFGSVVATCYGRYDVLTSDGDLVFVGDRDGGHCTSVVLAARDGNNLSLKVRDPASGGNLLTQSAYQLRDLNARVMLALGSVSGPITSVDWVAGSNQIRLIDSFFALRPKAVYDWEAGPPYRVRTRQPTTIDPLIPSLRLTALQIPPDRTVESLVISPDETWCVAVLSGPFGVAEFGWASLVDGAWTTISETGVDSPVGIDRFGYIYEVGETNRLKKYDRFADDPVIGEITLPEPVRAMTYVDGRDEVAMYSPSTRVLLYVDRSLPAGSRRVILPAAIPAAAMGQVVINPTDGVAWIQPGDSAALYRILEPIGGGAATFEMFSHPSIPSIEGFDFDDAGRLFVAGDGSVKEFMLEGGVYVPATDSPSGLNGQPALGPIAVSRSNHSWDPDTMNGPEWDDIDSDELLVGSSAMDCPGDINADGVVNSLDLVAVLATWGPCTNCDEDFDFTGAVGTYELVSILANWGACK